MDIKNSAELKIAILELEAKRDMEKKELTHNFQELTASLSPVNLIKNVVHKVKETPGLTGNIMKAVVGLGVGLVSKKLFIGKSNSILKKLLGSAVEFGIAGIVAKKSDSLKYGGLRLIKGLFGSKNKV